MSTPTQPLIVAHRGASADHPENTVEAFVGALRQGADWVELDVRLSSDLELVIHHDPFYGNGLSVSGTESTDRPDGVPLLEQALDACLGMGVNVEIKNTPGDLGDHGVTHGLLVADLVVELLEQRDEQQPILISSFDEKTLDRVREVGPTLDIGLLTGDLTSDPGSLDRAVAAGAVAVHPWDPFVDQELVERCVALGLAVNVWTVDDPDRIRELARLGVDAIITNTPALARDALSAA